jgi:hypothetical protein
MLALALLLIITPSTTIVFARHHGGGSSNSGAADTYAKGLDAGTSAAQSDNPNFDNTKSVSDCMNQGTTYSLAYCQGFVKGYYDTENSLRGGGSPSSPPNHQPPQQTGQGFNGGGSRSHAGLVAQVCNFAINHPALAKLAAVALGYPSLDTAVQALCVLR